MKRTESFIYAAVLALAAGQASAHLYVETYTGNVGLSKRLQCHVGYTEPDDEEFISSMVAVCHETYPYDMMSSGISIIVTEIPHTVTAFITIGSCPDGSYSWRPRVYIDFWPNPSPNAVDGWYEYPEVGTTRVFICHA